MAAATESIPNDARQRVLDVAEELFMQRGYQSITLRDVADALEMRQASLYYHFPEGKEQLFVAVATRTFERHRRGMVAAVAAAPAEVGAQLQAIAAWFASQPPLNLLAMIHADMPALTPALRQHVGRVAYDAMFTPLRQLFLAAQRRGEIRSIHPDLLAGSFLTLLDGLNHAVHQEGAPPRRVMVDEIITILLDGIRPRLG
ncbi:MAG: TetR/AcrR family transcriptional regulator [Caldilineaceae bacterium]|nr:TetR/AcrR family transcriptional regulator [Caldilineaceae bacterium]